jgi:hypothetical protein
LGWAALLGANGLANKLILAVDDFANIYQFLPIFLGQLVHFGYERANFVQQFISLGLGSGASSQIDAVCNLPFFPEQAVIADAPIDFLVIILGMLGPDVGDIHPAFE